MMPPEAFPILVIFSIPLLAIWTGHKRKMLELQLRLRGETDNNVRHELNAMREEIRMLRDTTMQYDLSFDTALQSMEKRMTLIERRVNQSEQSDAQNIQLGR
jgi:hypothetical protein